MNNMSIINLLSKFKSAKADEKASESQILKLQNARFKKLLKHVLLHSRFYQRHYKDHGVTLENYEKIELKDLPAINKNIMMENYDDFVCAPELKRADLEKFISDHANRGKKYLGKFQVISTSGSTGAIGLFVYGPDDWNMLKALAERRVSRSRINPFKKSKICFIGATDGMYAGVSLASDSPKFLFDFLPLSINSPLAEIIEKVNKFQPDILTGYSSGNYLLAHEQLKGNVKIKPRKIFCSADPLTQEMRATMNKAFGVEPRNFYAASESVCMGVQCRKREGIHMFNDWHCFELVDENFNQVQGGQSGNLLLTNLYNYTQPLIRYQMNDHLIFDDKKCGCSWPFPVIKTIAGRQEDFLWFQKPDGEKEYVHPLSIVVFFVPGLEKFQVEQVEINKFVMRVVLRGNAESVVPAVRARMNEILREKGLEGAVNFDVEVVNELRVDPRTGKFKLIIPFKALSLWYNNR